MTLFGNGVSLPWQHRRGYINATRASLARLRNAATCSRSEEAMISQAFPQRHLGILWNVIASLLCSHCASTAFESKKLFFFFWLRLHSALVTFLFRLLAFVPLSSGVSSWLSARPRKLQQWLLYNSKRRSIINLNVISSICEHSKNY